MTARILAVFAAIYALPVWAMAQEPAAGVDIGSVIAQLFDGVQNKNWMLVTCAGILVAVWVWNAFIMPRLVDGDKHPKWKQASPWISIGIGALIQVVSALIAGNDVASAVNTGVSTGLMAAGGWSAGGKYLLKPVETKLTASTNEEGNNPPPQ